MALLKQVDVHIKQVGTDYSDEIVCKRVCDSCCRFLNLFPVEAFSLAWALDKMDTSREVVRAALEKGTKDCPLLINHQCVLYEARPIICRTHGYPLYCVAWVNTPPLGAQYLSLIPRLLAAGRASFLKKRRSPCGLLS